MTLQDRITRWVIRHMSNDEPERYISTKSLGYWLMVDYRRKMDGKEE